VATVTARALAARDQEEGRGVLHDDPPDVRGLGDADVPALLAHLEAQGLEIRHDHCEARSLIFTTASLGGPFSSCSAAPEVQDFLQVRRT
jgi:hypothetical protein